MRGYPNDQQPLKGHDQQQRQQELTPQGQQLSAHDRPGCQRCGKQQLECPAFLFFAQTLASLNCQPELQDAIEQDCRGQAEQVIEGMEAQNKSHEEPPTANQQEDQPNANRFPTSSSGQPKERVNLQQSLAKVFALRGIAVNQPLPNLSPRGLARTGWMILPGLRRPGTG